MKEDQSKKHETDNAIIKYGIKGIFEDLFIVNCVCMSSARKCRFLQRPGRKVGTPELALLEVVYSLILGLGPDNMFS